MRKHLLMIILILAGSVQCFAQQSNDSRTSELLDKLKVSKTDSEKTKLLSDLKLSFTQTEEMVQNLRIKQTETTKTVVIASIIVVILLAVLLFQIFLTKNRNEQLQAAKQYEINEKSNTIEILVGEKKELLKEREWLIMEIHHRVKNNLQMVISLLNAQSEFIKNPSALTAIRESRERMETIAIIHKKLYNIDNKSTQINMRSYIIELVEAIKECFSSQKDIRVKMDIGDVELDISQSVPLGLILNEAITNAFKYAYSVEEGGTIVVSLKKLGIDELQVTISDTGKGLPAGTDAATSDTLGFQLMKLFSEQMEGNLTFINSNGFQIILDFRAVEYKNLNGDLTA